MIFIKRMEGISTLKEKQKRRKETNNLTHHFVQAKTEGKKEEKKEPEKNSISNLKVHLDGKSKHIASDSRRILFWVVAVAVEQVFHRAPDVAIAKRRRHCHCRPGDCAFELFV